MKVEMAALTNSYCVVCGRRVDNSAIAPLGVLRGENWTLCGEGHKVVIQSIDMPTSEQMDIRNPGRAEQSPNAETQAKEPVPSASSWRKMPPML